MNIVRTGRGGVVMGLAAGLGWFGLSGTARQTYDPSLYAGLRWRLGAIAVAPSNPDTVYVGSGENCMRDSVGYGNGMYKSPDAGKRWTHLGLDETRHIGKVAVDPKNPQVVYASLWNTRRPPWYIYAPSNGPGGGIFKTTDGGSSRDGRQARRQYARSATASLNRRFHRSSW